MKKTLALIALLAVTVSGFAQIQSEIQKAAQSLVNLKKYESAFTLLDKYDPDNKIPEILLMKEDIVLNYYVSSLMHRAFALKDLEKNESIMDYRGQNGTFSMFFLPVDSLLLDLLSTDPSNCGLHKGLACYYNEVMNSYGNLWLKSSEEVSSLFEEHSNMAISGGCADYDTYFNLGIFHLSSERFHDAVYPLSKAVELDPKNPDAHYDLAYALFDTLKDKALEHAKTALNLYKDSEMKADAAFMVGSLLIDDNNKEAIKYLELSDKLYPNYHHTLSKLLYLYLTTGNKKAEKTATRLLNISPENPTIYDMLEREYTSSGKSDELVTFYENQLKNFKGNKKVTGNLYFYIAKNCMTKDKEKAKLYFLKAKETFKEVFDKDHYVFETIDSVLKEL